MTSCLFAQHYRRTKQDGSVLAGPMVYLDQEFSKRFTKSKSVGKIFGAVFVCFAVMTTLVGLLLIGDIHRTGVIISKLVPLMCRLFQ